MRVRSNGGSTLISKKVTMRYTISAKFIGVTICLLTANISQGQTTPSALKLDLPNGAVTVEQVSWTFDPTCIRAWEVDIIASDPTVNVENLTGVLLNGCGGSTSSFDVQFTGDGVSRDFDLLVVDVLSNEPQILASIPTSISVPEPSAFAGLAWLPLFVRRRRRNLR